MRQVSFVAEQRRHDNRMPEDGHDGADEHAADCACSACAMQQARKAAEEREAEADRVAAEAVVCEAEAKARKVAPESLTPKAVHFDPSKFGVRLLEGDERAAALDVGELAVAILILRTANPAGHVLADALIALGDAARAGRWLPRMVAESEIAQIAKRIFVEAPRVGG
jgi:hypothetical protein